MRIRIAMSLMSAIFMLGVAVIFGVVNFVPGNSEYALAGFMSIISLFGSMLFLLEARKVLPRWYLAIPFCSTLFLIAILCFWEVSGGASLIQIVTPIVIVLLAFLSPFSVLVFLSLHRHPYSMIAYLAVSSMASIISMISFILAILEIIIEGALYTTSTMYSSLAILCVIYWLVVMPIVGLAFLLCVITLWRDRSQTSTI